MTEADPRALLGAFIRAHRERLPLPPTAAGRRRTPGWRREELAEATGVGVTWITWLEQGRDVSASPTALARLADALLLNPAERASLFDLAGRRDPVEPTERRMELPEHVLALPSLLQVPAYLLDHLWTARAWNAAAAQLFTGWLDAGRDRNLLRFVFLSPDARELIADWPERAQRLVAEFRADFSRRPRDAAMQALIDELSSSSALFTRLWGAQTVLHREGGERSFQQSDGQIARYQQTTLLVASNTECKLVCLVPLR
ncbi:XRE family transcriptional regulator [Rhodoferax lacus]|uniref:XRE family transcriptional regulator n=1 Tax=Rhodoferax lacus TaxID=2184758 RepID=A0A3E1RC36_9BURK|nr:helix-turn-helix transcriptional regulator [Rhodoferax lacus]RFO96823.1 XRE family transcriptional regulator [Rhodoferax lacus]